MEQKIFFKNSQSLNLCGIIDIPNTSIGKLIVIFAHGHSSSKNTKNYIVLKDILNKEGITTFRIDLRGHGESEGNFEETKVSDAANDILDAIEYVKSLGYQKIGLIGSSFGAISSIMAASKTQDLSFLALKSPVVNYKDKYHDLEGKDFVHEWKKNGERDYDASEGKVLKLKYTFYEDAIQNNGYEAALNIHIPTLIVHGDKDESVPVNQSLKLSKIIPDSKLVIVKGSDHRYTNESHAQEMLKSFADFIIGEVKNQSGHFST
jgi:esterase/lipase